MSKKIFLILILLGIYGCTSVSDIKSIPLHYGKVVNVNAGIKHSISHLKAVANSRGLELKESYSTQNGEEVLIYSAGVGGVADGLKTGVSYGEWIRVVASVLDEDETKVMIYAKRKVSYNIVGYQKHEQALINALKSI